MKKELKKLADAVKHLANELDEAGKARLEEIAAAVVALAENADDEGKAEIDARLEQLRADLAKVQAESEERTAEKIQKLTNAMAALKNTASAESKLTKEVRNEIAKAIRNNSKDRQEAAVMEVLKRNDITGFDFPTVLKIAIQYEHKSTELFDLFGTTNIDKHYLVGIDESDAEQIAKQFSSDPDVQKDIQQLAATGVTISTNYIGKIQRFANASLDEAERNGVLNEVVGETTAELERQTKRLAEKAAIVGDNVNSVGKKVTTFETIGTVTASNAKVTVVNPATANTVNLLDVAKAADAVDGNPDEKVLVIGKDLARELSAFYYSQNGSPRILSDDDLAAQIGVRKLVKVDYLGEVTGLHAVVLRPDAYKVLAKNEHALPWAEWRNNAQYFIYERNMGGALVELKSAAVLREA